MTATFEELLQAENAGDIITSWESLRKPAPEEYIHFRKKIRVPAQRKGRTATTTALRVVHAVQVFHVGGWYWHYSDSQSGALTTWLGLEWPDWSIVYTATAFVEARGASWQEPPSGRTWDSRVLFSTPVDALDPVDEVK
jgi:hypothetical protein